DAGAIRDAGRQTAAPARRARPAGTNIVDMVRWSAERARDAGPAAEPARTAEEDATREFVTGMAEAQRAARQPMPPALAELMMTGTPAVTEFVQMHLADGLRPSGKTFFYRSRKEFVAGLQPHLSRYGGTDEDGQAIHYTDAELHAQAVEMADQDIGVTLVMADQTIHINVGDRQHQFRIMLHEAMHQQVGNHLNLLGKSVSEGLAEYLSEIVLTGYGLPFTPHEPYATAYWFVWFLGDVFGQDLLVRAALKDDLRALEREFKRYAPGSATEQRASWKKFRDLCSADRFSQAKDIIQDFYAMRAVHEPADEAAEAAANQFERDGEDLERQQRDDLDRSTWAPEGRGPVASTIGQYAGDAKHTILTILSGGHDGVREGWIMEFDAASDFFGDAFPVLRVFGHRCEVEVPRPRDELVQQLTRGVRLRKP
ncbi:MAG: hypothetical protein KC464_00125, partial [Myxococcales bacterium]|nr:hypothetical protein [Myxococcales bacterium]